MTIVDEVQELMAENAKLREALQDIVRRYEWRSELHIDDATCAGHLYDTARAALSAPMDEKLSAAKNAVHAAMKKVNL